METEERTLKQGMSDEAMLRLVVEGLQNAQQSAFEQITALQTERDEARKVAGRLFRSMLSVFQADSGSYSAVYKVWVEGYPWLKEETDAENKHETTDAG